MPTEFDLIDRIKSRLAARDDVALGIGDDAALLNVPPGKQLVVTADTLNAGVHFPLQTRPFDIGWKALAVNLSDLAAMGAQPAWCTLALSLPQSDATWLDGFVEGFLELASRHGITLVGGDTTRGPLSIAVTAMGLVDAGKALRRDGARIGDDVWVSGTLGDAAAALHSLFADAALDRGMRERLDKPLPRVAVGLQLVGVASACIDISDGVLQDLGHICERSGVGAEMDVDALPASRSLQRYAPSMRRDWQAAGGDDYELCFTAAPLQRYAIERIAQDTQTPLTCIGRIVSGRGVKALDAAGSEWLPPRAGYQHF